MRLADTMPAIGRGVSNPPCLGKRARRMKKGNITRFKLNPKKPPKTDWRAFDAMSENGRHDAALSDADCQPASEAQLARARRVKISPAGSRTSTPPPGR